MSEPILPDQETATLALLMHREVDMRVMVALSRAINPSNQWEQNELEKAYTSNNPADVQRIVQSMLVNAILSDGSLMHTIRSKIGESLQRSPY